MKNNFKNIQDTFKVVADKYKNNIAVVDNEISLSYFELNQMSNKIANYIENFLNGHTGQESIIAVSMGKTYLYVATILGVLKCGCAFLPIDLEVPYARKEFILEDSNVSLVLTDNDEIHIHNKNVTYLNMVNSYTEWEKQDAEYDNKRNNENSLAYVIYTSGTTGNPKGTLLEHKGLLNLREFWKSRYNISVSDKILSFANISFDASVWEIFMSILTGAELHIVSKEIIGNFRLFEEYVWNKKITIVTLPPTYSNYLNVKKLKNLRILFSAGSSASVEFYKKIRKETNILFVNAYGPTETTICATTWEENIKWDKTLPIGYPIDNVEIYILNDKHEEMKNGEIGELTIAGSNLARGYLNNPKLNEEKFVFLEKIGKKVYKTGDLASKDSKGRIFFHGRNDNQVKIGGHRIELDEIKNALEKNPHINEAIVINVKNMILAFYTGEHDEILYENVLDKLKELLPNYMIPNYIKKIDYIPLTINDKPDTKELIKIYELYLKDKHVEGDLENSIVLEKCKIVLGNVNIGVNDNFFMLGGDSIKAIDLCAKLFEAGYELRPGDILTNPTIQDFAKKMRQVQKSNLHDTPIGEAVTTPIQRWFLNKGLKFPYQFNQSILLRCKSQIAEDKTERCLQKILMHHEVLNSIFDFNNYKEFYVDKDRIIKLQKYHVENKEKMYSVINMLQQSLNPEKGILINAAIIYTDFGDFLFICIHHLVCDGISMRILLEDFINLYADRTDSCSMKLPVKTLSYRQWGSELYKYYSRIDLEEDIKFWENYKYYFKDGKKSAVQKLKMEVKTSIFDKKSTEIFINEIPLNYNASLNEIMVSIFAYSYLQAAKGENLYFNLETHGRDIDGLNLNITRTVGWFTSEYPQIVSGTLRNMTIKEFINIIKNQLGCVPHKGQTFEMLKYYGGYNFAIPEPEINFNYMGDISIRKNEYFDMYCEADKMSFGPLGYGNLNEADLNYFNLNITPYIYENRLYFSCGYNPSFVSREFIEDLHSIYTNVFNELIKTVTANKEPMEIDIDVNFKSDDLEDIFAAIDKL